MKSQIFDSAIAVAEAAASDAVQTLQSAVNKRGSASWVLAGGSTPNLAYEIIAANYIDHLDWSRITFIIGDERIGPLDGPDNNWQLIEELFLQHVLEATFLRPKSDLTAEDAAADYQSRLEALPRGSNGAPLFDLVWLGMGEDGHTLSLFPDHDDFDPHSSRLVMPVHNSPKPPSDRISLTLYGLTESQKTVILATGEQKKTAVKSAFDSESKLPIAQAARIIDETTWFLDEAASS